MLSAYLAALRQLADPPIRRVIWRVAAWTAAVYLALGFALWTLIAGFDPTAAFAFVTIAWINAVLVWILGFVVGILGVFVFFAVFWILFVAIVQFISGFYLEDVAAAVEARHFAGLPPTSPPPVGDTIFAALRFFAMLVGLNLLALPFYLIPLFGLVVFYVVNGYLLGREYFDMVAMRRLDPASARALRRGERGQVFAAGLIATIMLSIPVLNLIAPIVATAAMVHLFEAMPGRRRVIHAVYSTGHQE